ncbi:MAG: hypothetical protein PHF00_12930 [Elusimicrobia bacterium]|nr:hypothetical protein [Elusimicrobiota bacterium]
MSGEDWAEDIRAEVDSVLGEVRGGERPGLAKRLEALRRRLAAKSAGLQADVKQSAALKGALGRMKRELEDAQRRAAAQQSEAAQSSALAEEQAETLRVSAQARRKLIDALDRERQRARERAEDLRRAREELAAALKERDRERLELEALGAEARAKDEEIARLAEAQRQAAEILRQAREQAARKDALAKALEEAQLELAAKKMEADRLALDLERGRKAAAEGAKAAALLEETRRALHERQAEAAGLVESARQAKLEAEAANERAARAMANAETVRREGNEAMDEAQELKEKLLLQAGSAGPQTPPSEPTPAPARQTPVRPAKSGRSRLWLWGVALAAAGLAARLWPAARPPARDYPVPFSHPSAMAWQDGTLWVADWAEAALFRLRPRGEELVVERKHPLPGARVSGLAVIDGFLYLADARNGVIEKRRLDDALTLEQSWPLTTGNVSALAWNGDSLYAAFSRPGRISRLSLEESLPVAGTFFASPAVVGLAFQDGRLWSADGERRLFLRHRADEALSLEDAYGLPELDAGTRPLACFTIQDGELWYGRDGQAGLVRSPLRSLVSRPVPEFSSPAEPEPPAPVPGV